MMRRMRSRGGMRLLRLEGREMMGRVCCWYTQDIGHYFVALVKGGQTSWAGPISAGIGDSC
jgi:hypothetical protein